MRYARSIRVGVSVAQLPNNVRNVLKVYAVPVSVYFKTVTRGHESGFGKASCFIIFRVALGVL